MNLPQPASVAVPRCAGSCPAPPILFGDALHCCRRCWRVACCSADSHDPAQRRCATCACSRASLMRPCTSRPSVSEPLQNRGQCAMGWHGQSLLVCMCVENESTVRPSTRVPRTLADIGRPALPSTYKHTPRSFWAHPDGSAVRKRNPRTVIVVAGAVTAAHDPPTRAADASRLSARCHQLSSKPARARPQ